MINESRAGIAAFGLHHPGNIPGPDQDYVLWGEASRLRTTPLAVDENLDPHYTSPFLSPTRLFIVADGMGGKERGEEAARDAAHTAFDAFRRLALDFNRRHGHRIVIHGATGPRHLESWRHGRSRVLSDLMVLDVQRLLLECVEKANKALWTEHGGTRGSTLLLAAVCDRRLFVAYVGDSRAYVIRSRATVELLTEDHNEAWVRVTRGEISRVEARRQGLTSMLTRYAGIGPRLDPAGKWVDVDSGDRILLCTDGLYDPLDHNGLLGTLVRRGTPEEAARDLIENARARGGDDNLSALVVEVADSSHAHAQASGRSSPHAGGSLQEAVSRFRRGLLDGPVGALRPGDLIRKTGIALLASAGALSLAATASLFPGAPRERTAETSGRVSSGDAELFQPASPAPQAAAVIGGTIRSKALKEGCDLDPLTRRFTTRGGETVEQIARWCEADAADVVDANRNIPAYDALPQDLVLNVPLRTVRAPDLPVRSVVTAIAATVDPEPYPNDPPLTAAAPSVPLVVATTPTATAAFTSPPTVSPARTVTPVGTPAPAIPPPPQNGPAIGPITFGASIVDQAGCRLRGPGDEVLDVPPLTLNARFDYTGSGSVVVRWYQDGLPMTEWRSLTLPGPAGCRLLWFGYVEAPLPAGRYTLEVARPGGGPDGNCCPSSQRALQWAWVVVGAP